MVPLLPPPPFFHPILYSFHLPSHTHTFILCAAGWHKHSNGGYKVIESSNGVDKPGALILNACKASSGSGTYSVNHGGRYYYISSNTQGQRTNLKDILDIDKVYVAGSGESFRVIRALRADE